MLLSRCAAGTPVKTATCLRQWCNRPFLGLRGGVDSDDMYINRLLGN